MIYYKVKNYGTRMKPMYSVDQVLSNGTFLCQEAYFFKGQNAKAQESAKTRMMEMIQEDAARNIESCVFEK